jgi:hypothetical protein
LPGLFFGFVLAIDFPPPFFALPDVLLATLGGSFFLVGVVIAAPTSPLAVLPSLLADFGRVVRNAPRVTMPSSCVAGCCCGVAVGCCSCALAETATAQIATSATKRSCGKSL